MSELADGSIRIDTDCCIVLGISTSHSGHDLIEAPSVTPRGQVEEKLSLRGEFGFQHVL